MDLKGQNISFTQTESSLLGFVLLFVIVSDLIPYLEGNLEQLKKFYISRLYISGIIAFSLVFLLEPFANSSLIKYYSFLEFITNALIITEMTEREQEQEQEEIIEEIVEEIKQD